VRLRWLSRLRRLPRLPRLRESLRLRWLWRLRRLRLQLLYFLGSLPHLLDPGTLRLR